MLTDRDRIKRRIEAIEKNIAEIRKLMAKETEQAIRQNKLKTDSLAAAVKRLSEQGLTQREIADKFGVGIDVMTVNAILKGFHSADEFKKPKPKAKAKPKRKP